MQERAVIITKLIKYLLTMSTALSSQCNSQESQQIVMPEPNVVVRVPLEFLVDVVQLNSFRSQLQFRDYYQMARCEYMSPWTAG